MHLCHVVVGCAGKKKRHLFFSVIGCCVTQIGMTALWLAARSLASLLLRFSSSTGWEFMGPVLRREPRLIKLLPMDTLVCIYFVFFFLEYFQQTFISVGMDNYTTGIFIFLSPVLIGSIQKLKCGPGCVQYNGFKNVFVHKSCLVFLSS